MDAGTEVVVVVGAVVVVGLVGGVLVVVVVGTSGTTVTASTDSCLVHLIVRYGFVNETPIVWEPADIFREDV
ncbi:hypothetical protein MGAD_55230 [Mycolicibacterium gadium]|uniref:Uncharacterized protein n=1 Tax=Mycolicibacterium gadium TaxID=1794 RepID=A0A7I7WZ10_MYCGU|nr:hypothetical protein MGAD_55230 [Mycolicibacterium gadium]